MNEMLLALASLLTSVMSGIAGMGGGMILVGLLPLFLPAAVIVPVHATAQLASNASRTWFGREQMDWRYIPPYVVGALAGVAAFWLVVRFINLEWVPLFIAAYILITLWVRPVNHWLKHRENFYLIGFIQVGVGMFVGSPGPLHMPLLTKKYEDTHTVVTVASMMMTFFHTFKIIAYVMLGFVFMEYWQIIAILAVSATAGSWLGVKLRKRLPMPWLKTAIPWILTLIAVQIIIRFIVKMG
ncbi:MULTISPECIES: sulfite exporter TauE/SafE family protein [Moraxella]|uniref:Probable membrane transporter protein n=2 Tax=Moraxella TaxID=475 RepID=A0A1S9ZLA5_9GAMM|nr:MULTISPECIES: sulfite exporter TauE/SafE family protein [Moraxella]OAU96248.1 hypothetical protein AO383_1700 [Moraxella catarrhalis]OAU97647.1 hypothetical protein AO385_1709 [Moraxella catarrhalis]OAU97779.1 hypothetical protein AO384_0465 [Moraxella catarrhalis]OOR84178.1 anion permease [Moraxella canis]WQE03258.1 sulfite exporter TauE/SafE family protein [Moraxella canis]